ncbi:uncharacterized protein LOC130988758 [Salvia miltiorrhiza]|uniref:uncharacterized protein LOC130988758 n=1 Tax=Salvia miltiorrhiza TaxID=226208 RepID=UPI0025ABB667|nr:uncharacterized protein LOC130988758 [Salvia miltiorrhiza]
MRNLQFLNMGSNPGFLCQKLVSLFHAISLFLIKFISYFSRLQKFGFSSKKNDKDMIFLEAGREAENHDGDKSELLHLKFKFPTFDEFSRIRDVRDDSHNPKFSSSARTNTHEFTSTTTRSVTTLIEVLTTFPLREIEGEELAKVDEEITEEVEQREEEAIEGNGKKVDATEFAENKVHSVVGVVGTRDDSVDESEFYSEITSDGFLSDGALGERFDVVSDSFGENKESPMSLGEMKKVEEQDFADFLSEKDFKVNADKQNNGEGFVSVDSVRESSLLEKDCSPFDNTNKLESLWEHQELIEQLQMELRKVKATGLPTIAEESETPKAIDELKPWKIDESDEVQHQDCMGELHKFYKSYREMMRKFDILNYQKMYAMGFVQLKDPLESKSQQKLNPAAMLKSLVSHKKQGSNPIKTLMNELQGDVEAVYVGQMCLSWEFLHCQYHRALELWSSDPHGLRRYNEAAADFQQFQVLVQRFTEDEHFQGPRVHSYVKTRCVLRNLLQVPLIREDCLEEERKKERDEYVITSEMLVEMVEESIRIFWDFVRSDKDFHNKQPQLHTREDSKLLIQLRRILQKKDRKLKDILRSEKCILRKFRKRREDEYCNEGLHFFAQVDVKLVSRVLNMSRISRDQLIWCENKLSRISFVNRKIYVEPAFLLFPC